ncbi:hypothetical protein ATE92_1679 [Ulvibacter sp. MAR_2010_11]|nr:hypothetical protein ATE92_1679 [Ulvibacter sp. MAR_2010_11]
MDSTLYYYTDQNNNVYKISVSEVKYDPISPEESSSGVYSGGEKAIVPISEKTFKEIALLAEALQTDTISHIKHREMRTSILLTEKGGKDTSRAILRPSEKRTALENLLRDLVE